MQEVAPAPVSRGHPPFPPVPFFLTFFFGDPGKTSKTTSLHHCDILKNGVVLERKQLKGDVTVSPFFQLFSFMLLGVIIVRRPHCTTAIF